MDARIIDGHPDQSAATRRPRARQDGLERRLGLPV